jgi:formylglycine-generating enzyme required for sulfatase activity
VPGVYAQAWRKVRDVHESGGGMGAFETLALAWGVGIITGRIWQWLIDQERYNDY